MVTICSLYGDCVFTVRIFSSDVIHSSLSSLLLQHEFYTINSISSIYVHYMVTVCSLYEFYQVTLSTHLSHPFYYSMNFILSILYHHYMFTVWSLCVYCMKSIKGHYLLISLIPLLQHELHTINSIWSPYVHCMVTVCSL